MRKLLAALMMLVSLGGIASAQTAAPPVAPPLTEENTLVLDLSTGGRVVIAMRPDIAPKHVAQVKALVRQHFYDGTIFHRVIDGFMAQGGDPTGTGQGGSKLPNIKAEFNDLPHVRGAVAMARATDNDSANSQFYICLAPALKLDHEYTVWGRVTSGMEFVDAIEKGEPPANPSRIVRASIAADHVAPPAPMSAIPAVPAPSGTPGASLGARQSAPITPGAPPANTPPSAVTTVPVPAGAVPPAAPGATTTPAPPSAQPQ